MAEMRYSYRDMIHTINTYDDIINTYDWIQSALKVVLQDRAESFVSCIVAFTSDEISYECDSIEEFKKYAFGKNIQPNRMAVFGVEKASGILIDVFTSYQIDTKGQEFSITAKEEMLIINLRDALQASKTTGSTGKEMVVMKIEDNSVHIGSNNKFLNSVVGSINNAEIEQKNEASEKETLASKGFWQIVVPIVVGVIVVAICMVLGLN